METIIGFIAGYLTGVSQGRTGMQRARTSLDEIRKSPEVRRMVADGVGLAQVVLGRVAKGGLSGAIGGVSDLITGSARGTSAPRSLTGLRPGNPPPGRSLACVFRGRPRPG